MSSLEAFKDAFMMILSVSEEHVEKMLIEQKRNILAAVSMLREAMVKGNRIHITGMGRSKLAGMIVGELLKLLGYPTSIIGDFLSKPVKKGDIVIAVSASGWTTTTCMVVEEAIRRGAKIIAFTATKGSKLDRLSDISIYVPGKSAAEETSYIIRQLAGRHKTPLTPMGTIPETNTILIGSGLVKMLEGTDGGLERFRETISMIISNARESFQRIIQDYADLENVIETISIGRGRTKKKIFIVGTGIGKAVSLMAAMRFQHLGLNVASVDDWKFRNKDDVLIAISSSGESAFTLLYADEAKRSEMNVIALTANAGSRLAKIADYKLFLSDFSERRDYVRFKVFNGKYSVFVPGFEYAALITLEAIVAQIAENLHVREEEMKLRHANIE